MYILGIESSFDETAISVINESKQVLSSRLFSQIELHEMYYGVIPELAAREHVNKILPLLYSTLQDARISINDIDLIAVTRGPGLIGSLMVGVLTAEMISKALNINIIGVNHVLAHGFAFLADSNITEQDIFPLLSVVISGGHSEILLFQEDLSFERLGETQDDAAGEAFDKIAKILSLPYPGGPHLSKAAEQGNDSSFLFPNVKTKNDLDFSFSGLKTDMKRKIDAIIESKANINDFIPDLSASFQRKVVDYIMQNINKAAARYEHKEIVVGGGVASNKLLRAKCKDQNIICTEPSLCTDNATMIAVLGLMMHNRGINTELSINPSLNTI